MKALVGLIVAANLVYYAAFSLYPPAGAALLILLGRGPDAKFGEAFRAFCRYHKHTEFTDGFLKNSRVVQDDPAGFHLIETPQGRYWEPGNDGTVVPAQLGEIESKYYGLGGLPVRGGDIVLDCGANVGVFTRAALLSGAKVVVAIEPAPENIVCLRRNFVNEIKSGEVVVYEKGVWDKDDFLQLGENNVTSAEDSFVRLEGTHRGPLVPLTTIDKLVQELKLERVDFIKMDIEGAEQRALAGARETLVRYRPRLEISVNHLPGDPQKVPEIIRSAWPGYQIKFLRCAGDRRDWRLEADILYFH